ncbi:hypothetical protein [Alteromonas lipolytica]|uniref:Uncharacterized protein n=1 Tax=Alteromonas lipolytica TaxID=1856405 RepID=A0A1E8FDY4_9ALTE|nr:hypothetical protein [Alteromonas lipolytica]OFI34157.1 hypothetical protein BFC17_21680 [Alteromonas lipolytica]GGF64918.1 hypothetical protein GCM10011338_16590 [Alteromonas lipolytica]
MDMFDTFIIAVGVALVLVGLYLFVSGKQGDGSRNSNVEGFGIKINVSNPSIILIVIGVGLILLPKFLPNPPPPGPDHIPRPDPIPKPNPEPEPEQEPDPKQEPDPEPKKPTIYFPEGEWYLTGYSQNGVDFTAAMSATIRFAPDSKEAVHWRTDYVVADMWGNMSQVYYTGRISYQHDQYTISITQTNDPSLSGGTSSQLIMNVEDNNQLHLEYTIGFNTYITHWKQ